MLNQWLASQLPPSLDQARTIARNLYASIRGEHGWGQRFDIEPADDVLDCLAELAPREMRRALMTGFGNARLAHRGTLQTDDLPKCGGNKTKAAERLGIDRRTLYRALERAGVAPGPDDDVEDG